MKATEVVDNLPKQTPKWAIGISVILVSMATTFGTMYVVAQDEIKEWLVHSNNIEEEREAVDTERFNSILNTVLSLTSVNAEQITELTKALNVAQADNKVLSERVAALEKSLVVANKDLAVCEGKLRGCRYK